jgi:hypothetical protein
MSLELHNPRALYATYVGEIHAQVFCLDLGATRAAGLARFSGRLSMREALG